MDCWPRPLIVLDLKKLRFEASPFGGIKSFLKRRGLKCLEYSVRSVYASQGSIYYLDMLVVPIGKSTCYLTVPRRARLKPSRLIFGRKNFCVLLVGSIDYSQNVPFDLDSVIPSEEGPSRPHWPR